MPANKQMVINSVIDWVNYRKNVKLVKSVKRMEMVVAAEVANNLQDVILDKSDLESIANAVGGTYVVGTGGNSKIKL